MMRKVKGGMEMSLHLLLFIVFILFLMSELHLRDSGSMSILAWVIIQPHPQPHNLCYPLEYSRYEPVGHGICVTLPVIAIFAAAAVLISHTAVDQQDGHVYEVEVGQ